MKNADNAIRRVLVPLDLSTQSARAIPYAERMAGGDAEIHLLHVSQPSLAYTHLGAQVPPATSQVGPSHDQLQTQLERLSVENGMATQQVKTIVVEGRPAAAIVDYATDNKIDLIVMTTHGETGLMRLMMGSVAEHVVRKAPCPVLTLKSDVNGIESSPLA